MKSDWLLLSVENQVTTTRNSFTSLQSQKIKENIQYVLNTRFPIHKVQHAFLSQSNISSLNYFIMYTLLQSKMVTNQFTVQNNTNHKNVQ